MATLQNTLNPIEKKNHFLVIHPLDDRPEQKVDTESLGPMTMTPAVRVSLYSLRAYLILMLMLVIYHLLQLARVVG